LVLPGALPLDPGRALNALHPHCFLGALARGRLAPRGICCAFGAGLVAPQAQSITPGLEPPVELKRHVGLRGGWAFNALPG
jgi:hypothetical protein